MNLLKNKQGSVFLGLALGIFIFVTGILMLPYLTDDVATFRVDLNCYGDSISNGNKLTCLFGGALVPYFIWLLTSLALGLIIGGSRN